MTRRTTDRADWHAVAPAELRVALLDLTPAQQAAAEALATGSTHSEAAEAAGVARETVTRWSGHHPAFRSALARYRAADATEQANRVRRIRAKALEAVERRLDANELDPLAVLRIVPPPGDTSGSLPTAGQLLDAEVNRTRHNLPQLPIRDVLEELTNPSPSDAERAETLTLSRLTAELDVEADR